MMCLPTKRISKQALPGSEGSCSTPQGQEGGEGELSYLCKVEFILTSRAVQVTSKSAERSKGRPSSVSQPEFSEVRAKLA